MHLAFIVIGNFIEIDLRFMEANHLILMPNIIIIIGNSFIDDGKNVIVDEIGLIQIMDDPVIIAMVERNSIGFVILYSSLIDIMGRELDGDNVVIILNRVE